MSVSSSRMASLRCTLRCSIHTVSNYFDCFHVNLQSLTSYKHLVQVTFNNVVYPWMQGPLPSCARLQTRHSCIVVAARFPDQRIMHETESCCHGTLPLSSSTRHPSRVNVKKGRHEERLGSSEYEAAEWVSRVVKDPMVEVDPITIRQQISAVKDGAIVVATSKVPSSSGPPSVVGSGKSYIILSMSAALIAAAIVAVVQTMMSRPSRSKEAVDVWSTGGSMTECLPAFSNQKMTNQGTAESTEVCTVGTKVFDEFNAPISGDLPNPMASNSLTMGSNKFGAFISRNKTDMGFVAAQGGMPEALSLHQSQSSISIPSSGLSATKFRNSACPPSLSTTKVNSLDSPVAEEVSQVLGGKQPPLPRVLAPPPIPKVVDKAPVDDLPAPAGRKSEQDDRESLRRALQAAMPIITIGGGAGGFLAGVDGSLELVGLIATISFIWYELLWAKRRNQLWAEVSAVRDHRTLAKFLKSKKGISSG